MKNLNIDDGIRELIYTRTGYLFLEGSNGASEILPKRLRGITNFITFLEKLPRTKYSLREKVELINEELEKKIEIDWNAPFKKNTEKKEKFKKEDFLYEIELIGEEEGKFSNLEGILEKGEYRLLEEDYTKVLNRVKEIGDQEKEEGNRRRFKEYFFNSVVKERVGISKQEIVKEWLKRGVAEKNSYLVRALNKEYKLERSIRKNIDEENDNLTGIKRNNRVLKEVLEVVSSDNNPQNISLGDVLFVLDKVESYFDYDNTKDFIFILKSLYSIYLYDYYKEENKKEGFSWSDKYIRLIGGSFINPYHKDLITLKGRVRENYIRQNRDVNRKSLEEYKYKESDILKSLIVSVRSKRERENRKKSSLLFYEVSKKSTSQTLEIDMFRFFINNEIASIELPYTNIYLENKTYIGNIEVLERIISLVMKKRESNSNEYELLRSYFKDLSEVKIINPIKYINLTKNKYIEDMKSTIKEKKEKIEEIFGISLEERKSQIKEEIKGIEVAIERFEGSRGFVKATVKGYYDSLVKDLEGSSFETGKIKTEYETYTEKDEEKWKEVQKNIIGVINEYVEELKKELKDDSKGESKEELEGDSKGESKEELDGGSKGELKKELDGDSKGESKEELDGDSKGKSKEELDGDSKGELKKELDGDSKGKSKEELDGDSKGELKKELDGDSKGESKEEPGE